MKRKTNYELLRIIAMLMIISAHYLDKGNVLTSTENSLSIIDMSEWLLEAFCVISVNIYVLLSGFMGYERSEFRPKKTIMFWIQVLTYSVVISIIAIIINMNPISDITKYDLIDIFLPLSTERYWFATSFFILLLFIPFLNEGIRKISQKQFRNILLIGICFFSLTQSFLPVSLPYNKNGYDAFWLIIVYLCGAYLGKYGMKCFRTFKSSLIIFFLSVFGIWGVMLVLNKVYLTTGKLQSWINHSYSLNFIFVLAAAIAALSIFQFIHIKEGRAASFIRKCASCCFGVYLIHEHPSIRYLWPQWFRTEQFSDSIWMPLHFIGTIVTVFLICALIEGLRQMITVRVQKCIEHLKGKDNTI